MAAAKQPPAAAGGLAQPATAAGQQQQQQQLGQGQYLRQVSINVDATQRAQQQSGTEDPTSGPQGPCSDLQAPLPAVHTRLTSLSLYDGGVASVPLEVASPLRGSGSSRGSSIRGSDGGGSLGAVAAALLRAKQPDSGGGSRGLMAAQGGASAQRSSSQEQGSQQLTADEHHARGYALRKRGDFAAAVREYTAALAQDPSHFKSLFNRAFSLDKVGGHAGGRGKGARQLTEESGAGWKRDVGAALESPARLALSIHSRFAIADVLNC